MLKKWLTRHTVCRVRGHHWSRARRVSVSAGAETCKVCGATQMVTLRPKRVRSQYDAPVPEYNEFGAPPKADAIRT